MAGIEHDPVIDPLTEPASDASLDGVTDPEADPTGPSYRERAEAYQLALRGQIAGLQRRLAEAEAKQPLRDEIAALQRRLASADARATRYPFWIGLTAGFAFVAGVGVMLGVSRFATDRSAAQPAVQRSAPIVTPIEPPVAPSPVLCGDPAPRCPDGDVCVGEPDGRKVCRTPSTR
jgi:hypothetical protein